MKLRVFLIGIFVLCVPTLHAGTNDFCNIFGIRDRILNVQIERSLTLRDSDLAAGTADLLIIVDEVMREASSIKDASLRQEVEDFGNQLQGVLIRLIEDVLSRKASRKNQIRSLADFPDENVLVLVARFKNISEKFSIALLHPEEFGLATNVFVYALERDTLHPSENPKVRELQQQRIALLSRESGFKIPYSTHSTQAHFVKIERPTSEQMHRGNAQLILLLDEVTNKEDKEEQDAVKVIVPYLDEKTRVTNPDFSLSSIDNNVFKALVLLAHRHPDTIALAIRGFHEQLIGSRWSKDIARNCFNVGLNNAANAATIGINDPQNTLRSKTLLGKNESVIARDMQMAHSLISIKGKPKPLTMLQHLRYNTLGRSPQKLTNQDQVAALIRERERNQVEKQSKLFLQNHIFELVKFSDWISGRFSDEAYNPLAEKHYNPFTRDETLALSLIYKYLDTIYLNSLSRVLPISFERAITVKDIPFFRYNVATQSDPHCVRIHHYISIENGQVVALRFIPLDEVEKEEQVALIIKSFPQLKELSLLVDLRNLDIDLIIKLQLLLDLDTFELIGILNNNGTPALTFPKPYRVAKPALYAQLERDLLMSSMRILPKQKTPPSVSLGKRIVTGIVHFFKPQERDEPRGDKQFKIAHKNHEILVERDQDPEFKNEKFIYRIFIDNKLVGTYASIDSFRYVDIDAKDGTRLFELDNYYYKVLHLDGDSDEIYEQNETDVLRIEIDMDRILAER